MARLHFLAAWTIPSESWLSMEPRCMLYPPAVWKCEGWTPQNESIRNWQVRCHLWYMCAVTCGICALSPVVYVRCCVYCTVLSVRCRRVICALLYVCYTCAAVCALLRVLYDRCHVTLYSACLCACYMCAAVCVLYLCCCMCVAACAPKSLGGCGRRPGDADGAFRLCAISRPGEPPA